MSQTEDSTISDLVNEITTLSDDDEFVVDDASESILTNKTKRLTGLILKTYTSDSPTLTTPSISSFVNSIHDHSNNVGGGQFSISNLSDVDIEKSVVDIEESTITEIINSTGDGTNILTAIFHITTDSLGNIFVCGRGSDNVFKISADLSTITQIIDSTGDGTNPLDSPTGLATDSSNNIYVTGQASSNAFKISADLSTITQIIDSTGDGTNPLTVAEAVTVDSNNNIYITGQSSDNAFKISADLSTITEIINSTGDGTNILDSTFDVKTDSNNNIFVTGRNSNNAFKISADLLTITEIINSTGDGTNSLSQVESIAVDTSNNIFVAGRGSSNAFKISADLSTITEIIDSTGDGTNTINNVISVAVDSNDNIFVGSLFNSKVFKISEDLSTITQIIDITGDGTNSLNTTGKIVTDSLNNIFVAGTVSDNAFKISEDLSTITQIIDSTGDGTNTLDSTFGISVDSSRNIYVTGQASNNAFKISADLSTITQIIDSTGDGTNSLDNPSSIAVDSNDNIFVDGDFSDNTFKIPALNFVVSGLYLVKESFTMSNPLSIGAGQTVSIQFEDQLNTTITYDGDGTFITGDLTTGQLEIINCRFVLSGANSEFVDLPGGNYRMINTAVSYTGTGTRSIGTFDSNGNITISFSFFSGYNVGFTISNVGSIGVLDSFFVSDFTGTSSLFNIDSSTGILGFNNFGVFIGGGEAIFDIQPTIDSTIQLSTINSTISTGGEFYKSRSTANISTYSDTGLSALSVTSVEAGTSNAKFTTSTAHGLVVDDIVVHTGFTDSEYNGTKTISIITDTTNYETSSTTFTATDTGTSTPKRTTILSGTHGLSNDDPILITSTINYNGGYLIKNALTNTFEIQAVFVTDENSGVWNSGSLDETAINVDARQTPGSPDSVALAYGDTNANSVSTTVTDNVYSAIGVSQFNENSITELFSLVDTVAAIWRYDGLDTFKGFLIGTLSASKTGSTASYRFAVSIDSVLPSPSLASYIPMEVKTDKVTIPLEFPISLSTGQTFQIMVAGDGTSDSLTITDVMFGAQ